MTILEMRQKAGLSQSQFAKKFHLNVRTVQSWEQGWRVTPESYLYLIQTVLEYEGVLDKEDNNATE